MRVLITITCAAGLLLALACSTSNSASVPAESSDSPSTPDSSTALDGDPLDASVGETDDASDGETDASLSYPLQQACATPEPSNNACHTCILGSCCASLDAALRDGADLIACIQAPGCDATDAAMEECLGNCFERFPEEVQVFLDHGACTGYRCDEPCNKPTTCSRCIDERCALENAACNESPDCYLLTFCTAACSGAEPCTTECFDRYPGGAALLSDLEACGSTLCLDECG